MKKQYKITIVLFLVFILLYPLKSFSYNSDAIVFENESNTTFVVEREFYEYYPYYFLQSCFYSGRIHYLFYASTSPITVYFENGYENILGNNLLSMSNSNWDYDNRVFVQYFTSSNIGSSTDTRLRNGSSSWTDFTICYSSSNIVDNNGDVIYSIETEPNTPYITNTVEELSSGTFDYLTINSADYVGENWQDFYLLCYDYSSVNEDSLDFYPRKEIKIEDEISSKYFYYADGHSCVFRIPKGDLGLDFRNDCNYEFKLAVKEPIEFEGETIERFNYFFNQKFTVTGLTSDEQAQNSYDRTNSQLEEQTQAIKEQTETNKGILGTIGNILSFINPLSENFFAYKLLNLLYEGLKALFIPSNEFFSDWFMDLNDTFADQFGILYYPVNCIIEFLTALDPNLTNHEPIIHIPEFSFSFFGANATFLHETTYNLNDVLQNERFATVYRFYLFFVDVIFSIGVIAFAKKIFLEIFGGVDDTLTQAIDNRQSSNQDSSRPLGYKRGGSK